MYHSQLLAQVPAFSTPLAAGANTTWIINGGSVAVIYTWTGQTALGRTFVCDAVDYFQVPERKKNHRLFSLPLYPHQF